MQHVKELSCELLTIFDLQEIYSNVFRIRKRNNCVVNCLRSLTYKRFIPTKEATVNAATELWIAYDLWLTRDLFQHQLLKNRQHCCCELLTIFDLQEIYSNHFVKFCQGHYVVNCLRSLTYKRFIPTPLSIPSATGMLWIAYDLWLTRDLFQRGLARTFWTTVVNCLRSLTYKRFIPTKDWCTNTCYALWIAYDLWLTRDLFQPTRGRLYHRLCCELLTIFDLQEIYSNVLVKFPIPIVVVNCLRSLTYKRFIPTIPYKIYNEE